MEELFSILVWGLLIVAALFLFVALARWALGREGTPARPAKVEKSVVQEVLGLDLREEALPQDVVGEAGRLWKAGRCRAALALLYRACLVNLRERHGVEFERGDTERICQAKEQALGDRDRSRAFAQLTHAWQRVAYGSRPIPDMDFERSLQAVRIHFLEGKRA